MILLSYVSYFVTILCFWCIKQTTIIFYCLRKWITLIANKVTRIMQTLLFSVLWYCYKKIFIERKLNRILSWLAIHNRLTTIKIESIYVFIFLHFLIVCYLVICIDIWWLLEIFPHYEKCIKWVCSVCSSKEKTFYHIMIPMHGLRKS